jgi:tRNA (guanine9-N1)-methyltransferase
VHPLHNMDTASKEPEKEPLPLPLPSPAAATDTAASTTDAATTTNADAADAATDATATDATADAAESSPMGKRKRKRIAKSEALKEKWDTVKRQKAAVKAAAAAAAAAAAGSTPSTEAETAETERSAEEKNARKQGKIQAYDALCDKNFAVIIDCAWESEHSEKALNSLSQQIMFCYSMSKKSSNPCRMHLTGVEDRLQAQLSKVLCNSWMGVSVQSTDYRSLGLAKELVYLTSDAEDTLDDLDPNCAYIIGGIVDRNRLKGVTYEKAILQGIRTAKLPIKEYCSIKATPVLTVNHVFDILLSYSRCRSWPDAFKCILPQRKSVEVLELEPVGKPETDESTDTPPSIDTAAKAEP